MQRVSDIKSVHIELTDKCQAQCPMCARNYNGGPTRPFIQNKDISIDQFKEWFPKKFLAQLTKFYSCGNYGDPAFARDCLEIYSYVRECNPTTRLSIHTNGGMRNPEWWSKLPQYNIEVVFAVDGFKGKHEVYRKNTNFDKVIENMTAFINAGGYAIVDSLVFAHNEHDVDKLEQYLLNLGVRKVNFISTTRFYNMTEYEVYDTNKNIEYKIYPATLPQYKRKTNFSLDLLTSNVGKEQISRSSNINPVCENQKEVYIDPHGNILPCCWIGSDYLEEHVEETLPIHHLRNLILSQTKEILKVVGIPKCQDGILKNSNLLLFERFNDFWQGDNKCMTCVKNCSSAIFSIRKNSV